MPFLPAVAADARSHDEIPLTKGSIVVFALLALPLLAVPVWELRGRTAAVGQKGGTARRIAPVLYPEQRHDYPSTQWAQVRDS